MTALNYSMTEMGSCHYCSSAIEDAETPALYCGNKESTHFVVEGDGLAKEVQLEGCPKLSDNGKKISLELLTAMPDDSYIKSKRLVGLEDEQIERAVSGMTAKKLLEKITPR